MNRISRLAALIGMVVCAACVFAASASAAPPAVTTGSATGVSEMQATLNGTVTPLGQNTSYSWEYGPTTSYGYKVFGGNLPESFEPSAVSKPIAELATSTLYHYRLVATNKDGTTLGADKTFTTLTPDPAVALGGMATTEPFDGGATSLANFSANWASLGWASAKGEDTATGWRASAAYPSVSGAYLNQTLTDAGQGLGVSATMATAPSSEGHYVSLWLDMSNPGAASRAGYELRVTAQAGGTYRAALLQWVGGVSTPLGTASSVALAAGNSIALSDYGSSVKAWTNTGSGFKSLLSATNSLYSSGKAGVEASGNVARLTKFKVGALLAPVANNSESLSGLSLRDGFRTAQNPLSSGGAWGGLTWASGTGLVDSVGWGPNPAAVNGAYWQKAAFADTGSGVAIGAAPVGGGGVGSYFSLWLDMPSPGSAKTGYEARFTDNGSGNLYEVTFSKWQAGVKTSLGSAPVFAPLGASKVAFVDKGSSLTIWTKSGEGSYFLAATAAADSTFNGGFAGIESSGIARLRDLRAGPLAPF